MASWEKSSLYDRVESIQTQFEKERSGFESNLELIAKLTRPDLPLTTDSKGQLLGSDIYEGTSAYAPLIMANGFSGYLAGADTDWFRYYVRHWALRGEDKINEWLQARTEEMQMVYAESNFYEVLPHIYLQGLTIGTPIVFPEEDFKRGSYTCTIPHYTEVYFSRDSAGRIVRLHRVYKIAAMEAAQKFGKSNLSKSLQDSLDQGDHWKEYEFIRVIYPREDMVFDNLPDDDKYVLPDREWLQFYIERTTEPDKKLPLSDMRMDVSEGENKRTVRRILGGYDSRPFSWWDYQWNTGELWGRSPAWSAIHDICYSQESWKSLLQDVQLAAQPPMVGMDTYKSRAPMKPRGWLWAKSIDEYEHPPKPIDYRQRVEMEVDFLTRITDNINRWFHKELFTLLMTRQKQKQAPLTATEVAAIMGEEAVMLSPGINSCERFLSDFDRSMTLLHAKSGRLPMPQDFGLDMPDISDVQFIGLFAKSQRARAEMQPIIATLALYKELVAMHPPLEMKIRWNGLAEDVLELGDFPQKHIVSTDEYEEAEAAYYKKQEMANSVASAADAAKVYSAGIKPIEENSAVGLLAGVG